MSEGTCGHCGRPFESASRGTAADGTVLCHTGTIPPDAEPPDCCRLVTIYGHASDGLCCRSDRLPGADEIHALNEQPDVRVDVYTAWPLPARARATHTPTGIVATAVGPMADYRARVLLARKLAARAGESDD